MATQSTSAQHRRGIIAACSWTVDRIKIIDSWPEQEHLAEIIKTDQQGGGCGHNLGVDVRKLDQTMPVEAIGLTGTDADGEFLQSLVKSAGIDTSQFIAINGIQTSFTDVISVADTGRRTFFHHPGSHDHVTPEHFNLSRCAGKILHLGLLGVHATMDAPWQDHPNGWAAVLQQAQSLGIHTNLELVSIDPVKIRTIALPCIPLLNTLIVNEYELGALADIPVTDKHGHISVEQCIVAATQIHHISKQQHGTLGLVVAHSPGFAVAVTANGEVHKRQGFQVKDDHIVSTVGAGDAFAAGMLYGIHEQWSIDRSLELAHATAAASLRSANTVGSVESADRCLELVQTL